MEALFPAFCLQIFGCQRLDVSICLNQTLFTGPSKSESERVTNTRCLAFLRLFQALKSKGSNVFKRLSIRTFDDLCPIVTAFHSCRQHSGSKVAT